MKRISNNVWPAVIAVLSAADLCLRVVRIALARRAGRGMTAPGNVGSGPDSRNEREAPEKSGAASFDEGFENIMRYSVNGHTGLDVEE